MWFRPPSFDFDDEPLGDAWSKWGLGVAVPSLIAAYGLSRIILRQAILFGRRSSSMPLYGWDAIILGLVVLAIALFIHAHYFWSNSKRMAEYADFGKAASMIVGIAGLGFVVVRNFSFI